MIDFVPTSRPAGAKVLWLGEAPGELEGEGKSGQLQAAVAHDGGISEPWAYGSVVHCRSPEGAAPTAKEIQCCLAQHVLDDVRGYPWVVLVGNAALTALFPGAQGTHFRGNVAHHPDYPGQKFYATYHPSQVLRRPSLRVEYDRQLARLGALMRGERALDWRMVRAGNLEFERELDRILAAPLVSWDVETSQLESWTPGARITSMAFTADGETIAYVAADEPQFGLAVRRWSIFLEDPNKHVLGANVGFDLVHFEQLVGRSHLAQEHDVSTLYYEMGKYKQPSLKELASIEGDGYLYLMHHGFKMPDIEPWYNSEDVVQTLRLYRKGMVEASAATRDLVMRTTSAAGYVLRRITHTGFYIRQDYRQRQIEEHQARREAAVAAWAAEDPQFIPTRHESGNGLIEYLFTIKRLPVEQLTETGEPSTDRLLLKRLVRGGATYLQHLLTIREIDKVMGTYLTAYDAHLGPDSRVHSKYTTTSTDTGRPSSREPNVQNIPQRPAIRDLFGVPYGSLFGDFDLSQIEFRIMVCLAHDEKGIAGYLRGEDAHTMTARIFSTASTPTKEDRTKAKPINFALLYGGAWPNIQRQALDDFGLEWTEAQCRTFEQGFMATYPRIPDFQRLSRDRLVANRGWFESVTGHCFRYAGWDDKDHHARDHTFRRALNSAAQGPAAQICFDIMVGARRLFVQRKIPVQFVNTVYDSAEWELADSKRAGDVVEAIEEARAATEEWIRPWFPVPLVLEHAVGPSWGSLEPWRRTA
jgi:uracil-DNA glycosylase family 4